MDTGMNITYFGECLEALKQQMIRYAEAADSVDVGKYQQALQFIYDMQTTNAALPAYMENGEILNAAFIDTRGADRRVNKAFLNSVQQAVNENTQLLGKLCKGNLDADLQKSLDSTLSDTAVVQMIMDYCNYPSILSYYDSMQKHRQRLKMGEPVEHTYTDDLAIVVSQLRANSGPRDATFVSFMGNLKQFAETAGVGVGEDHPGGIGFNYEKNLLAKPLRGDGISGASWVNGIVTGADNFYSMLKGFCRREQAQLEAKGVQVDHFLDLTRALCDDLKSQFPSRSGGASPGV